MTTDKLFTSVGVTTEKGQTKVRFANDYIARVKVLVKCGHTDIDFFDTPKPMTKAECCKFILTQTKLMAVDHIREAIEDADAKYNPVPVTKVRKTRTPRAPKATATAVTLESIKAKAGIPTT